MLIATRDPPTINGSRYFRLRSRHEDWIVMLVEGGPIWLPGNMAEGRYRLTASYGGLIVAGTGIALTGGKTVPEHIGVSVHGDVKLIETCHGSLVPVSADEERSYHFQQMLKDVFE